MLYASRAHVLLMLLLLVWLTASESVTEGCVCVCVCGVEKEARDESISFQRAAGLSSSVLMMALSVRPHMRFYSAYAARSCVCAFVVCAGRIGKACSVRWQRCAK